MKLKEIFDHQHKLAEKYNPIEEKFGYWVPDTFPAPLNTLQTQDRLRMFYAYICEEIAEAALSPAEHFSEELSDILHFATEFALIAGVDPICIENYYHTRRQMDMFTDRVPPTLNDLPVSWGQVVNLMKYKRWKQSPKDTSISTFHSQVLIAYSDLLEVIELSGFNPHEIYMDKHKKNEERIATGY